MQDKFPTEQLCDGKLFAFFFFFSSFSSASRSHIGAVTRPRLFDWFIWVFESMWAGTKHILKCERQKVAASVAMLNLTMYDWDIAVESRSGLRSFIVKDYIPNMTVTFGKSL